MAHERIAGSPRAAGPGDLFRQPDDLPEPDLTRNSRTVLEKRYLRREGKTPLETPGGGFWRVATEIARGSGAYISPAEQEDLARQYYLMMAKLEFIPNSPTLMNAGKSNGLQYSACYVLPVGDSMEEIFETNKRAALIHQSGGGCIAGDSRVWTTFCGIEPIQVLVNRATVDGRPGVQHGAGLAYDVRDLGIRTLSMNPASGEVGLRPVSHVWRFDVPAENQVVVTLREGTIVQTSDWHPFMVVRGTALTEVPAAELEPGDVVLGTDRPEGYWPWKETRRVGSLDLDPELGWLIGFTLGDGAFGYVPALRQFRVRWFSGTEDVLARVQRVLARQGIQVSIQKDARGVLSVATLTQRFVHDLLEACGLEKIGPKDALIRVPEIIAKSPLPVVRAFLAGLLDSDGYVDLDGSPSYTTASEAMAEDVAALVSLLGYQPTVRAKAPHGKGRHTTYTVQLCPLPAVNALAADLSAYLSNARRRDRLHSDSGRQTALQLSFRAWRDRLAGLGLVKARGDRAGGPGPCAEELDRWSCNEGGRVRRDDLRAIAASVRPLDAGLAALLTRLADSGQEVAHIARAAVAKPYYDLSVEDWNTYAAGRSGLAMIHNTGFAFSRLRPAGDVVGSTGGVASGPISFLEVFNASTESVKQGGTRRGANMGILRVDHPDVMKFIECKKELNERHRAAYDAVAAYLGPDGQQALKRSLLEGQIANFNISVAVTDRFMSALYRDEEYELVNPRSGEVAGTLSARAVFEKLCQNAWETGDPGVVFIDRINAGPANPVPSMGPVEATNPCVTGDTLIYTGGGLRRAADLAEEGAPLQVVVDGEPHSAAASPVFRTGRKPVFRLETTEGYTLRLTADHRVMTRRGWVPAADLRDGDEVRLLSHQGGFGQYGTLALGRLLGWLVGDGTLTSDRAVLSFFGDEKRELAPQFADMMAATVPAPVGRRAPYDIGIDQIPARDEARVRSARFWRVAVEHGLQPGDKHKVPDSVFVGGEEMQRGFLQALFTADGHVSGWQEKGVSVRLTSISQSLLQDVQRLLLNFGIASTIFTERRSGGLRSLPDGHGGRAEYQTSAYHDLVIAKDNLQRFASGIGFLSQAKQDGLVERLAAYRRGPYRESFYARFAALVPDGAEDVYDLTEPQTHSFIANGLCVHNCGEQPLYPNEACNLGSINLMKFVRTADLGAAYANGTNGHALNGNGHHGTNGSNGYGSANGRTNGHARSAVANVPPAWRDVMDWERLEGTIRLATRFLDDVIEVNPYPDAQIDAAVKANRRIGLGVMGWADVLMRLEMAYDSREALELGETLMKFIQDTAEDESTRLAEQRGPFPNWSQSIYRDGPPRRNATVTTIAPTGTISIIAGCSSGIEPIFALAFDRKGSLDGQLSVEVNDYFVETAKRHNFWSDATAQNMARHGTARGVDQVPEHWQTVFGTAHDISPEWHVRMQGAWQKYTENAVSKTINLPRDAGVEDVAKAYRLAYELGCAGITVYRDGSKEGVLHVGTGGGSQPQPAAATASAAAVTSGAPIAPPQSETVFNPSLRSRPRALRGVTFRQETPLGTAYVTINEDEHGQPYEVFVNQGKAGSDVSALAEAIGKLTSIVLRTASPMPPRERLTTVARKLRGIGGSSSIGFGAQRARSLPDAVAKVLEDYLGETDELTTAAQPTPKEQLALPLAEATTGEFCPDCGNALVFEEGCSKCMDPGCGYSRC